MQWWCRTWQPNGFSRIRTKQKLHRKHKGACKSSWSRRGSQKSFTLTIPWNFENLVKNYPGIIVRLESNGRISPYFCERPIETASIWPKSLARYIPRLCIVCQIWKGDTMVADIEELEETDGSELHALRLNAKEVLTPMIEKPLDGYAWSVGRLTRKQTTSRPDNVWPDMWKHVS